MARLNVLLLPHARNAMSNKKQIGFWNDSNNSYPNLPNPKDLIDLSRDFKLVADYIDNVMKDGDSYKGWSSCRLCGRPNGSSDKYDNKFLCPEGYSHYIRDHKVVPDKNFSDHVFKIWSSRI